MAKRFLPDELRKDNYKLYHGNYRIKYKQELKEKNHLFKN